MIPLLSSPSTVHFLQGYTWKLMCWEERMGRREKSFVVNQGHSILWGDFILKCFLLTFAVSSRQAHFTFF